jgi:hypothetical protein
VRRTNQARRTCQRARLDGSARASVPPPTHEEWLVRVIKERLADRGASF